MTLRKILTAPLLAWYRWRLRSAEYDSANKRDVVTILRPHVDYSGDGTFGKYIVAVTSSRIAMEKMHSIRSKIARLS